MDVLTAITPTATATTGPVRLSVVVPVFNEEEVLPEFHRRLTAVLDTIRAEAEAA